MKEIGVEDLNKYIDPLKVKSDPAIVMASDGQRSNGMTIGWASYGVLWKKNTATVYIHAKRFSKQIFDNASYYAICYMKPEHKEIVKYFGTVSGKDEDKLANCGLDVINDVAPYFADAKAVVFCRIMGRSDFDINYVDDGVKDWYNKDGVHSQYYGEIIKVLVNE